MSASISQQGTNTRKSTRAMVSKETAKADFALSNSRLELSRAEKSLTALTTKFMTLLQESHNGVLDLRSVNI